MILNLSRQVTTKYNLLKVNEGGNQNDCKSYTLYDLVMADGPVTWISKTVYDYQAQVTSTWESEAPYEQSLICLHLVIYKTPNIQKSFFILGSSCIFTNQIGRAHV